MCRRKNASSSNAATLSAGYKYPSYAIKGNIPRVRERLQKAASSDIAISAVTEAELRFGLAKYPEATRLKIIVEEFLRFAEIRSWDSDAARHYAAVRSAAEREGRPIGSLDMMIAAHALALGAVLVTGDRVFRRIAGLKVEDWSRPA